MILTRVHGNRRSAQQGHMRLSRSNSRYYKPLPAIPSCTR
jgi:hypothetical protein